MEDLCKVLIVDDEILLRQGLKHLLQWEKEGFTIVGEASTGEEALDIISKNKPHIVISDVVMPGMDGVSLCQKIKSKYPDIQIIILSSYSDFNYVKDTFKYGVKDYILKPTLNPDELLSLLRKLANNIPGFKLKTSSENMNIESILVERLCGYVNNDDKEFISSVFVNNSFIMCSLKYKNMTSDIMEDMASYIKKQMPTTKFGIVCPQKGIICAIINFNIINSIETSSHLQYMADKLSETYENIFLVISRPFKSIDEIKNIYDREVKKYLNFKFYYVDKHFCTTSSFNNDYIKSKFDLKRYSESLYVLEFESSLNYFRSYIGDCIKLLMIDEPDLKALCDNVIYTTITILDTLSYDVSKLKFTRTDYFTMIDQTETFNDLLKIVESFCAEILSISTSDHNEVSNYTIDKILAYISEHYNEQLSLKMLADKFHFNYYYLSSYFTAHNKEGFSEYLNKIRINKAIQILKNSDVSISEVSYMVGYSDNSYFCKVFKKYTDYTPSRYKKIALEGRYRWLKN